MWANSVTWLHLEGEPDLAEGESQLGRELGGLHEGRSFREGGGGKEDLSLG